MSAWRRRGSNRTRRRGDSWASSKGAPRAGDQGAGGVVPAGERLDLGGTEEARQCPDRQLGVRPEVVAVLLLDRIQRPAEADGGDPCGSVRPGIGPALETVQDPGVPPSVTSMAAGRRVWRVAVAAIRSAAPAERAPTGRYRPAPKCRRAAIHPVTSVAAAGPPTGRGRSPAHSGSSAAASQPCGPYDPRRCGAHGQIVAGGERPDHPPSVPRAQAMGLCRGRSGRTRWLTRRAVSCTRHRERVTGHGAGTRARSVCGGAGRCWHRSPGGEPTGPPQHHAHQAPLGAVRPVLPPSGAALVRRCLDPTRSVVTPSSADRSSAAEWPSIASRSDHHVSTDGFCLGTSLAS